MGTGRISYEQALTAVFVEGFIFIAISLLGVRTYLTSKRGRAPCSSPSPRASASSWPSSGCSRPRAWAW